MKKCDYCQDKTMEDFTKVCKVCGDTYCIQCTKVHKATHDAIAAEKAHQ